MILQQYYLCAFHIIWPPKGSGVTCTIVKNIKWKKRDVNVKLKRSIEDNWSNNSSPAENVILIYLEFLLVR